MMRDTVSIPANGFIVLRFIADNPGVWFFHCHIDLHLVGGMGSTLIEAPDELQARHSIPDASISVCQKTGRWWSGNCAGENGWISDTEAGDLCNTVWNAGGASEEASASGDEENADNDNGDGDESGSGDTEESADANDASGSWQWAHPARKAGSWRYMGA
jgi:iron transport multicopper oxidase